MKNKKEKTNQKSDIRIGNFSVMRKGKGVVVIEPGEFLVCPEGRRECFCTKDSKIASFTKTQIHKLYEAWRAYCVLYKMGRVGALDVGLLPGFEVRFASQITIGCTTFEGEVLEEVWGWFGEV